MLVYLTLVEVEINAMYAPSVALIFNDLTRHLNRQDLRISRLKWGSTKGEVRSDTMSAISFEMEQSALQSNGY